MNQAHLDLLHELADGSDSAELVVFDDIAHNGFIKETELVVDVIRELLADL